MKGFTRRFTFSPPQSGAAVAFIRPQGLPVSCPYLEQQQLAGKQALLLTATEMSHAGMTSEAVRNFARSVEPEQARRGGGRGQKEPELAAVCGGNDGHLLSVTMWGEVIHLPVC